MKTKAVVSASLKFNYLMYLKFSCYCIILKYAWDFVPHVQQHYIRVKVNRFRIKPPGWRKNEKNDTQLWWANPPSSLLTSFVRILFLWTVYARSVVFPLYIRSYFYFYIQPSAVASIIQNIRPLLDFVCHYVHVKDEVGFSQHFGHFLHYYISHTILPPGI